MILNKKRDHLLVFLFLAYSTFAQKHLVYQSPLNNSSFHTTETNVIFRADAPIDKSATIAACFDVIGAKSGVHKISVVKGTPVDVVVLEPGTFDPGETVQVKQKKPIKLTGNTTVEGISFSFSVSTSVSRPGKIQHSDTSLAPFRRSAGLPAFSIDVNNNPYPYPIFFRNTGALGDKYYGIINNDGSIVHVVQSNPVGQNFSLQENGWLTVFDNINDYFLVLDTSFQPIDTLRCGNGYITDMHDCRYLSNGHKYMMAYDDQIIDMSQIVSGGNPAATVTGTILQELDAQGTVIFQWRTWDHFQITDATLNLTQANIDYAHGNSIEITTTGDWVVSFRNMDEITKIDGTTGNIIWRFSGKNNQFVFVNDTEMTSKQHDARIIANGHLTVMDNGNDHSVPLTKAKEYSLDESAMTATLVWSYPHPNNAVSSRTGNVQRLPNGNTFINWGYRGSDILNPNWTEVTSTNTITYQFRFTAGTGYNTYRAMRHPWDTLNTSITAPETNGFVLYPNPGNGYINIRYTEQGTHRMRIVDLSGRLVQTATCEGKTGCIFAGDQDAGIYLIITEDAGKVIRKQYVLIK